MNGIYGLKPSQIPKVCILPRPQSADSKNDTSCPDNVTHLGLCGGAARKGKSLTLNQKGARMELRVTVPGQKLQEMRVMALNNTQSRTSVLAFVCYCVLERFFLFVFFVIALTKVNTQSRPCLKQLSDILSN